MQALSTNKYRFILLYYTLLLALFLSWQSPNSVPGGVLRIVYMTAVFAPVLYLRERWLLPPIVIVFHTLSHYGFTSSYMPDMWYTYVFFIIIALIATKNTIAFDKDKRRTQTLIIALFVLTSFVDFATSGELTTGAQTLLIFILVTFAIDFNGKNDLIAITYSFVVVSFVLSLQYVLFGVAFVESINVGGLERIGLQDINYTGCIISLGVQVSLIHLFTKKFKDNIMLSLFVCVTIGLSLLVLAQNASRGSFLCIAVCLAVLVLFSKNKIIYKIIIVSVIVGLIVFLYNSGFFDVLEYRLENADRTGSRMGIWTGKLNYFNSEAGIINYLFGIGMETGRSIGGQYYSTHNDFLSYYIYYGLFGLILFLSFLSVPFRVFSRKNLDIIVPGFLGLCVIMFTLEPFAKGMIPYYAYMIYLILTAKENSEI